MLKHYIYIRVYDIHVFFLPSIFSHSIYLHKCIISKCGTATEPPNCAGSLPQRFWITRRMWTNFLAPWQLSWSDANIFCCSPKDGDILGISYLKNCSQTMYCVSIYIYILYILNYIDVFVKLLVHWSRSNTFNYQNGFSNKHADVL